MENKLITIGVIIGRFQSTHLHDGHKFLIEEAFKNYDHVIFCLGNSRLKDSLKNPLDFKTRESFLRGYIFTDFRLFNYTDKLLGFFEQTDNPSNEVWSKRLNSNVIHALKDLDQWYKEGKEVDITLIGGKDSFVWAYSGIYKTIEFIDPKLIHENATEAREKAKNYPIDSFDFRSGVIYTINNQHNKIYPTVDIAILKDNNTKFILGRKPGNNSYQFPGGFVELKDENYEAAAKREAVEECGNIELDEFKYICSKTVYNWRFRSEPNKKVITTFFKCQYIFGQVKPSDDLEIVEWFDIKDFNQDLLIEEHKGLFQELLKSLK